MARKMASIQRIWDVEKHPNADALDLVRVIGWRCVLFLMLICSFAFAECKIDDEHMFVNVRISIRCDSADAYLKENKKYTIYKYYDEAGFTAKPIQIDMYCKDLKLNDSSITLENFLDEGAYLEYLCNNNGEYIEYYKNGQIKHIGKYKEFNYPIGEWKLYFQNGTLAGITSYKNGNFVSNKCTDGRFGNENLNCLEKND